MAEENDAQDQDVEAEMLRMMQEELGGDDAEGGEEAAAEGGGDGIDNMLEQEMLKAMETEGGGLDDSAGGDPMAALAALGPAMDAASAPEVEGIDRLTDVDVEITVELGENHIAIADIMGWTKDSVVELLDEESEPVNVMLNGTPFAKGEIVVVGDTFGIRIKELLEPPDQAAG